MTSRRRSASWFDVVATSANQWGAASTAIVLMVVLGIVLWQLGGASALLSSTTTTGGDTAAHYMMPAALDQFLRHGHLTGWFPGWFNGLPLYTFYFVLPDLFVALGSHLIGYQVAFKLATVAGSLLLPFACYALARGFKLARPFPALFGAASLLVLFEQSYTIDGGNLYSTLAGEYSYSLSIALAVCFLALAAGGLGTRRRRATGAMLLAATLAAHALPVMTALLGLGFLVLFEVVAPTRFTDVGFGPTRGVLASHRRRGPRWQPAIDATIVVVVGLCLMGWWLVPFVLDQRYANPMGYVNVTSPSALLWPGGDQWAIAVALLGAIVATATRARVGLFLVVMTVESGAAVVLDPQGSIYNTRLLPPYFVFLYLTVAWTFGVCWVRSAVELRRWRAARFAAEPGRRRRPVDRRAMPGSLAAAAVGTLLAVATVLAAFPEVQQFVNDQILVHVNAALGTNLADDVATNNVGGWAAYNYAGMEARGVAWLEFQGIMAAARHVGATDGCGRMLWEYESNQGRFGSTMALMLLHFETGGCIDSEEGLLFESSATTPYHFMNQAELSVAGSEAQVGLPYRGTNVPDGVAHLVELGVRYYLVSAPSLVAAASKDPRLHLVATTAPYPQGDGTSLTWRIYEVAGSGLVTPLSHLPVVVPGIGASSASWLHASTTWYADPARFPVPLAANGPASWPRGTTSTTTSPALAPTTVRGISVGADHVAFDVTRLGVPVEVKISYFPNWHVAGAIGPFRVTPNSMVVVPTSHHVVLTYGATPANWLGEGLTVVGLAATTGLVVGGRRRRGQVTSRTPRTAATQVAGSSTSVASVSSGAVGDS